MENQETIITKKVSTPIFEGTIEVAALPYPERIKHSKKSLVGIGEHDGKLSVVQNEQLDMAQSYYELAAKQVRKVDVKIVSGEYKDQEIKNIDGIMIYQEGAAVVMELATMLIAGVMLGEKSASN